MPNARDDITAAYDAVQPPTDRTLVSASLDLDPEKVASNLKDSARVGIPPAAVEDYADLIKTSDITKAYDDLAVTSPKSHKWASQNAYNMALLRDATEQSKRIEAAFNKAKAEQENAARPLLDRAADAATGAWVAAGGLIPRTAGGLIGAERMFSELFIDPSARAIQRALGISQFGIGEALAPGQKAYATQAEELSKVATEKLVEGGVPESIAPGVTSGFQMVGQIAQAIIAPTSVLPTMAASTTGEAYGQAREKGLSPMRATPFALGQGAIEYGTERLAWGKFIDTLKAGNPITKAAIGMAIREVPGEQAATFFQDLNEALVLTPEKPMEEFWKERPNAALQTLVATLVGGGGMVTVSAAVDKLSQRLAPAVGALEQAQAEQSQKSYSAAKGESDYARLATLVEAANEHPLRARHEGKFNEYLNEVMQDSDLAEVYIDAAALNEVLSQSKVDLNELKNKMPAVAVQLQEGLATKGIVSIPTADLLTNITDPALQQALLPHLKTTPDGLNYNESQAFFQTQVQELEQQAQKIADEAQPLLSREEFEQQQDTTGETPEQLQTRADERVAELGQKAELTPEEQTESEFLAANREAPEALAQHFDVALQAAPAQTYEQYLESRKGQAAMRAREVETLRKDIIEGIRSTGAYNEAAVHALAAPLVSLYQFKSAEMGLTPSELMKAVPLRFVADQLAGRNLQAHNHATQEDFTKDNIGNILSKNNWSIMTAENPGLGVSLSAEENAKRNAELKAELEAAGFTVIPVDGVYDRPDEKSFLVLGITEDEALSYGKKYGQDSVLTREGFLYQDGTFTMALGVTVHDTAPEQYYTTLPDGGMFTIDMEMDADYNFVKRPRTAEGLDPAGVLGQNAALTEQVKEGKLPEGPLSQRDTQDLRRLWEMYVSSEGEVAQYGTSDAKATDPKSVHSAMENIQEIVDAVYAGIPDMKPVLNDVTQYVEGTFFKEDEGYAIEFSRKVTDEKGATKFRTGRAIFDTVDRTIQLDVSKWGEGGRGAAVYKVLLDFARNNGFKFIGDTAGISEAGIKRRLENLLSHALQTNDVSYMALHPDQIKFIEKTTGVKIQWFANDAEKTIEQMLNASYNLAIKETPEIKNVYFDFTTRMFVDSRTGRTDRSIDGLVSPPAGKPDLLARKGKAGSTTLARTALSSTVLRAPEESRHLVLRAAAEFSMAGLPGAERLLYQQAGQREGAVNVIGHHFSQQRRPVLDGRRYGTGISGAESRRLNDGSADPRIKQRLHFYVDEGKGVFPEVGVGYEEHIVQLNNMYDGARNPLRFPSNDANAFEKAVVDAGFNGYYIEAGFGRQGVAVLLGDASHTVRTDREALFQSKPLFYSQLARAISEAPDRVFTTGKATAAWLQANTPKFGIKKDELFWTGVVDWMQAQDKVTKASTLAYLEFNGVRVRDVMLGEEPAAELAAELAAVEQEYEDAEAEVANARFAANGPRWADEPFVGQLASANLPGWVQDIASGVRVEESMRKLKGLNLSEEREQLMLAYGRALARRSTLSAQRTILRQQGERQSTKFGAYVLPGGENYRELLLTLPSDTGDAQMRRMELAGIDRVRPLTPDEQAEYEMLNSDRELSHKNFKSQHFDQLNILAHVRFNERTDAEGKRVLFIEEVQSDWGQKGKKEGFVVDANRRKEIDALREKWEKETGRTSAEWRQLNPDLVAEALKVGATNGVPSAPFVTDTKNWTALALKRMMAYAVENNFDSIAWTTGEQQAERYDLSKQVDRIHVWGDAKEGYYFEAQKNGRTQIADKGKPLSAGELADYIGKDLAKNAVEKIGADGEAEFTGNDLKVGGEGMKGFYDAIMPQVANDIIKKFGGKVEPVLVPLHGVGVDEEIRVSEYADGTAAVERGDDITEFDTVAEAEAYKAELMGAKPQPGFAITDKMRASVQAEGLPLFQGRQLAYFDPERMSIAMLSGANLSSMIHESGHFYLEALRIMSAHEKATPQMKADFETALKWFGVPDRASWDKLSLEQKRPFHEQWAQSFERWTMEGKAPSVEMQPVFARFRAWMLSVYKSLEQFLQRNPLAGKLNDEVRGVFSRLMASEEAIKQAERVHAYAALMQGEGVSDEEYAKYMALGDEATQDAITEMQKRSLRDMKWLSNAKHKALRKLQREAAAKRKVLREEATKEVMSEPVNQLRTFLTKGETTDPATGDAIKVTAGYKMNTEELKTLYPETMLARPDLTKLRGMTSPTGLPLDILAQQFGFTSPDAMVRELIEAEPAKEKIDGLTDQRMLERFGELVDAQSVEQAANAAVHNEARARFLATGLTMLTKNQMPARDLAKAAKEAADNTIARKKVRELRPKQYSAAEARENKKAIALAAKSPAEAADAQRAALLNNRLSAAASDALEEVDKALRLFDKFQSEGVRKNLDIEYLEQIDDLLKGLDTRRGQSLKAIDKRRSFADFIKRQEDLGFEPILDAAEMEAVSRKHYKDMTVEELRGLVDSIKSIEHLGRLKKKLLTAKDAREFAERIAEAVTSIEMNSNRRVAERASPSDMMSRAGSMWRGFLAEHRKVASIVREMDGSKDGGVMWDMFIRPMNEAGDLETAMRADAATNVAELFSIIKNKMNLMESIKAKRTLVPGTKLSMTYEERVMFALNWGNMGNRQRLLDGGISGNRSITEADAQAVLDTLDKADWEFVQQTWDYLDTFRPQIAEQERRLTGKEPKWVEPAPVQTKFGIYRGGYFPAKYDAELSTRSESLEAATNLRMGMKGAFGAAATRNGYTQKRSEEVKNRPLSLTFNVIPQHVNEVIHRLSFQDWLVDANRILRALDGTIRDNYGPEILKEMRRLVEDVAAGDAVAATTVERAINHIRVGSTIVGMGWRVTTALLQPSGLAQSWVRIGGKWTAVGVKEYLKNPMRAAEIVNEKSSLMRDRGRTMQREINEVLNTIRVGDKVSNVQASYFWFIAKMQRTVDIPTWLGAYEKAVEQLGLEKAGNDAERKAIEEKAVAMADQAVIDAQSGGQLKDLARVQRGSPIYKLFTNFYSYFSATYNLNVEAYRRASFKDPAQVGQFAVDLLVLNTIPVLFSVALKELLKGGCDNDDLECLAKKIGKEQMSYLFGQMILLREAGAAVGALTGDSFGYAGPAGLRFFSDMYKAGQQVGQGEADFAAWKASTNALGTLLHLPMGQVNSTLEGIIEIEKGNVDGVGILPAVIAGKERKE